MRGSDRCCLGCGVDLPVLRERLSATGRSEADAPEDSFGVFLPH